MRRHGELMGSEATEDLRATLPNVSGKLERVVTVLDRDVRRHGAALDCGHASSSTPLFVCSDHPAGGVRCMACAMAHTLRHDAMVESTCDQCGEIGNDVAWTILAPTLNLRGLPVRRPRGGRGGVLFGPVVVTGVAVCQRCRPMPEAVRS